MLLSEAIFHIIICSEWNVDRYIWSLPFITLTPYVAFLFEYRICLDAFRLPNLVICTTSYNTDQCVDCATSLVLRQSFKCGYINIADTTNKKCSIDDGLSHWKILDDRLINSQSSQVSMSYIDDIVCYFQIILATFEHMFASHIDIIAAMTVGILEYYFKSSCIIWCG
jgi:hypothetical protein